MLENPKYYTKYLFTSCQTHLNNIKPSETWSYKISVFGTIKKKTKYMFLNGLLLIIKVGAYKMFKY